MTGSAWTATRSLSNVAQDKVWRSAAKYFDNVAQLPEVEMWIGCKHEA